MATSFVMSFFRVSYRMLSGHVAVTTDLRVFVLLPILGLSVSLIGALHRVVEPLGFFLRVRANFVRRFIKSLADFGASAILSKCAAKNGEH